MKLPLSFEMTTTQAELRRLLPAAVNHVPFADEDGAFVHHGGARSWRITLKPLPQLVLGSVQLERYRLDFEFSGYSADEIEDFMTRFEMYFRRGGG